MVTAEALEEALSQLQAGTEAEHAQQQLQQHPPSKARKAKQPSQARSRADTAGTLQHQQQGLRGAGALPGLQVSVGTWGGRARRAARMACVLVLFA